MRLSAPRLPITEPHRIARALMATATVPMYPLIPWKSSYIRWLREEVEHAGCLYVKFGQWVSSRTDIFPADVVDEFSRLRNASEPMPFEDVRAALAPIEGLICESTPVSTGSIAQVHRGRYRGAAVAVKIRRPGIAASIASDVSVIRWLLGLVAHSKIRDDLCASLDDVVSTIVRELDFHAEASNMTRFAEFFKEQNVVIPRVYDVSDDVIVMEYIENGPFCGRGSTLIEIFLRQFFQLGWLHTDMHAGNVGSTPDGRVVLFDFGSVLEIPSDVQLCIRHLMVSYLNRNVRVMVDYMVEYGLLLGRPDLRERAMLESFVEVVLQYVEKTDIGEFTAAVKDIPVYADATSVFRSEIFMVMRSFTLVEGMCKELDPDFVILDAVQPFGDVLAQDAMMWRLKIEDDLRHLASSFD